MVMVVGRTVLRPYSGSEGGDMSYGGKMVSNLRHTVAQGCRTVDAGRMEVWRWEGSRRSYGIMMSVR